MFARARKVFLTLLVASVRTKPLLGQCMIICLFFSACGWVILVKARVSAGGTGRSSTVGTAAVAAELWRLWAAISSPAIYKPIIYIFLSNAMVPGFGQIMCVSALSPAACVCDWL
jgi:hypothetical protein